MKLIRLTVASVMAAEALAGSAHAAADPGIFGVYAFTAEDGEHATWTLTPCADDVPGCVRVAETGNAKRAPWSGDAHWSVGSLILFVQQPDAILCEDGPAVPGTNTYSWDGASMSGSASILSNGACGTKTNSLSIPFTLTRVGPAELRPPAPPAESPASPAQPSLPPPAAVESPAPAAPQDGVPAPTAPLAAESTATGPAAPATASAAVPVP